MAATTATSILTINSDYSGGSMARINIEDCWWSDARRTNLLLKIGFAADAAAVNMWRTAQEFWGRSRLLVPIDVFMKLQFAQELIDSGLAVVRDRSVYVRGSSELLEWHAQKREQAAAAGRKSAEIRKAKCGSAQPQGGKGSKPSEREPNDNRTEGNGTEASGSGSGSDSGSSSHSARGCAREAPPFDELVAKIHPITMDLMRQKAKGQGEGWLEERLREAYAYHLNDPSLRKPADWAKKFQSWVLEEGRRRRRPEQAKADLSGIKFDDEVAP